MSEWLAARANELRATIAEIERLRDELSYLQLGWRPPDGGWSAAQVFEHLILTDSSYLAPLERIIENGVRGDGAYRPTLAGGWLIRSLQPTATRRVTTPSIWRPPPEARADVVAGYLKVRARTLALVERAGGLDLRRNRMASPASRLIRLNLGDAIVLMVVHTQRHLGQIERLRARPDFPV